MENKKNIDKKQLLDPSAISQDAVTNFYKVITVDSRKIIDKYFLDYLYANEETVNSYKNHLEAIDKNLQLIEEKKKSSKFTSNRVKNGFINGLKVIGIGFAFKNKQKELKENMNEFKEYEAQLTNENDKHESEKNRLMSLFFCGLTFDAAFAHIMKELGMEYSGQINNQEYLMLKSHYDFLDIKSACRYLYKNTPIYDLTYRYLNYRDVVTSKSQSFPYQQTYYDSEGKMRTRTEYETVTAYHHEMTPFLDWFRELVFMTNWKPDVKFSVLCDPYGNKPIKDFENREFSKKFNIHTPEGEKTAPLMEFFTIKTQEEYLKLYDMFHEKVAPFQKYGNTLRIRFDDFYVARKRNDQSYLNSADPSLTLVENCKIFSDEIYNALCDISEKMVVGLISPVINREWYLPDSNYRIQLNGNQTFNKDDSSQQDYSLQAFVKMLTDRFVWFNRPIGREPFFQNFKFTEKDNWKIATTDICSFTTETLIDHVTTSSWHCGSVTIPVEYVKYNPISMKKQIHFLPRKTTSIPYFEIGPKIRGNIHNDFFKLLGLKPSLSENFWTMNPNKFYDEGMDQHIKDNVARISELAGNNVSVIFNNDGFMVIADPTTESHLIHEIKLIIKHLNSL